MLLATTQENNKYSVLTGIYQLGYFSYENQNLACFTVFTYSEIKKPSSIKETRNNES